MTEINRIFNKLEELTDTINETQLSALRTRRIEYSLRRALSVLNSFLIELNYAGKTAAAQWAVASIIRDDPTGLPVIFCLDRIRKAMTDITPEAFLRFARQYHEFADGPEDPRAGPKAKQYREDQKKNRIRAISQLARDVRANFVSLMGNPPPTDLFTRVSFFSGLSDKEVLAAFLGCISDQNMDWVAKALSEAQNARGKLSGEQDGTRYTRTLQLADIYLKAIQLHLKNQAQHHTARAPLKKPAFVKSDMPRKHKEAEEPHRSSSSHKLPFTS